MILQILFTKIEKYQLRASATLDVIQRLLGDFVFVVVWPFVHPLWSCPCGSVHLCCDVVTGVGVVFIICYIFHKHDLVVINSRYSVKRKKEIF